MLRVAGEVLCHWWVLREDGGLGGWGVQVQKVGHAVHAGLGLVARDAGVGPHGVQQAAVRAGLGAGLGQAGAVRCVQGVGEALALRHLDDSLHPSPGFSMRGSGRSCRQTTAEGHSRKAKGLQELWLGSPR